VEAAVDGSLSHHTGKYCIHGNMRGEGETYSSKGELHERFLVDLGDLVFSPVMAGTSGVDCSIED
jgi:hypothetical protein